MYRVLVGEVQCLVRSVFLSDSSDFMAKPLEVRVVSL